MIHCPPIYGKRKQEGKREVKRAKKDKDKEMLRELVPKRF